MYEQDHYFDNRPRSFGKLVDIEDFNPDILDIFSTVYQSFQLISQWEHSK